MVRLTDLPEDDRKHMLAKACPAFETTPFVAGPPLAERRLAVVTTAGLQRKGDRPFWFHTPEYRVLPGEVTGADLVMSHSSVNFDRTGFQQDVNVAFPIDRLRELEAQGEIGSLADFHYAFMGANVEPVELEAPAAEIAGLLKEDGVNAVLLVPV